MKLFPVCILAMPDYKVGDPRPVPDGYLQWHEWAGIQHKGGLRQRPCKNCGRYLFPQEVEGHKCNDR